MMRLERDPQEDFSFKESSVREVTDLGRDQAIKRLQAILAEAPTKKRKAGVLNLDSSYMNNSMSYIY